MMWFWLATCSAILSAIAAIVQKKVLFHFDALEFSLLLSVCVFGVSFFIPLFTDVFSTSSTQLLIILSKSVLGAGAFLLVMLSLQRNEISSALPILGLTPAATALLAASALGESLKGWEWGGIVVMMIGLYLLEKKPNQKLFDPWREVLLSKNHITIFGAVSLFAVSSVADKALVSTFRTDPLVVLFYQNGMYVLVFAVAFWFRRGSIRPIMRDGNRLLPYILAAAFLTVCYRLTQLEATKIGPVALVLAVKRTSIIYASFFGGRIFSDERRGMKLLGAALIVVSGFMILRNVG